VLCQADSACVGSSYSYTAFNWLTSSNAGAISYAYNSDGMGKTWPRRSVTCSATAAPLCYLYAACGIR
jgi:hypothetical protein